MKNWVTTEIEREMEDLNINLRSMNEMAAEERPWRPSHVHDLITVSQTITRRIVKIGELQLFEKLMAEGRLVNKER